MSELTMTVGLDWSEDHLDACAVDVTGRVLGEKRFEQSLVGVQALVAWLTSFEADPSRVGIGIELKRGPVVTGLMERGFRVASINPKQLDRFRDRFTVAGAKDDRRDARALGDALRTDPRAFRWIELDDPLVLQLREAVRMHEDLKGLVRADANRLRDQLLRYFPAAVELAGEDLASPWFLELMLLVPTPAAARAIRQGVVTRLLRSHHIRKHTGRSALEILRQPTLPVALGASEAASRSVRLTATRLQVTVQQLTDNLGHVDGLVEAIGRALENEPGQESEQHDLAILQSLPGVGRIVVAVLLAEAWEPLRHRDYRVLRVLCGVAPVTKRSGKRCNVMMRRACNPHLRDAVHHMARTAVQHDPHWRQVFDDLRPTKHSAAHAYRIIGDRLLRVMVAALRGQARYDKARLRKAA